MPSVSSLLDSEINNEQTLNKIGEKSNTTIIKKDKSKKKKDIVVKKKIKKKDFDIDVAQIVYRGVESILEKDEFDIFTTKSKKIYDLKIQKINSDIENMIQLNTKLKSDKEKISSDLIKLKKQNDKKIAALMEKLS